LFAQTILAKRAGESIQTLNFCSDSLLRCALTYGLSVCRFRQVRATLKVHRGLSTFSFVDVIGQLGRKALARPASFSILDRHPVPMAFVASQSSSLIMNLERKTFIRALSVMRIG
jgi:hypothetical protein